MILHTDNINKMVNSNCQLIILPVLLWYTGMQRYQSYSLPTRFHAGMWPTHTECGPKRVPALLHLHQPRFLSESLCACMHAQACALSGQLAR